MREQSRLDVQITLKELVSDALMFEFFFFSILAICKKNQHSEGSRCVTETSTVKNNRRRKIIKSGGFWDDCGEL